MRYRPDVVGVVDFGSREIRALIARKGGDGSIQVLGHGTAPARGCVSQGVIQDLGASQVALKRVLAAAENEARISVPTLFCGVNGRNVETFIREGNVKLEQGGGDASVASGVVEQTHMEEALDIASRDVLSPGKRVISSITAQEWYVDDLRVIDPVGIRGHVLKTRVHFARLPAVIEDNIAICIDSQRRELEDIVFLPLAAAMGCLTPEDMELGVAVLDMGRSTTGLALYRDHRILGTHCFEWGGYHITRDVAAGLQVSFEEADELILEYGISDEFIREELQHDDSTPETSGASDQPNVRIKLKSAVRGAPTIVDRKELDLIVYERAKELMTKIRQLLHARGLTKNLVRGIVLTGGGGAIKNQVALAEAVFRVPCRLGLPDSVDILPHAASTPEFSAAVGIVHHAFEYRAAVQSGRIEGRGPAKSIGRRLAKVIKKYFI